MRIARNDYYLNIALECSRRGTCLRRNFGAIIVKNNQIVSTGYTGAPRGRANCCDLGKCRRIELNVPQGERYELCRSVHAEMNAIISAARWEMIDAAMYINGFDVETGAGDAVCPLRDVQASDHQCRYRVRLHTQWLVRGQRLGVG